MFKRVAESKAAQVFKAGLGKAVSRKAPVWLKACRTLALTAATLVGIDQVALPNLPGRPLTDGETVMLREVFRDSVDYNKIRIHHSDTASRWLDVQGAEGATHKNVIVIKTNKCSDDYSRCSEDYYKYVLMHEAVHVWQGQNSLMPNPLKLAFENYSRILPNNKHHQHYEYGLTPGKPLSAYNVEQQASIITDYHMYVKNGESSGLFYVGENHKTFAEEKAAYERSLQQFHQNPSYLRR